MWERWVCSVLLAVLALLAIVPAAQARQVENLVLNNSFEEDEDIQDDGAYDGWWTWNSAEGAGSVATVDETEAIDGVRSIRIDPRGTAHWHFIVAYSTLSMDMSKDYTVSFWAKAAEPRSLTVAMKAANDSVNALGGDRLRVDDGVGRVHVHVQCPAHRSGTGDLDWRARGILIQAL